MAVKYPQAARANGASQAGADCHEAAGNYVHAYAVLHGKPKAAQALGVSRYVLWRFLHHGHTGRVTPQAVLEHGGGTGAVGRRGAPGAPSVGGGEPLLGQLAARAQAAVEANGGAASDE